MLSEFPLPQFFFHNNEDVSWFTPKYFLLITQVFVEIASLIFPDRYIHVCYPNKLFSRDHIFFIWFLLRISFQQTYGVDYWILDFALPFIYIVTFLRIRTKQKYIIYYNAFAHIVSYYSTNKANSLNQISFSTYLFFDPSEKRSFDSTLLEVLLLFSFLDSALYWEMVTFNGSLFSIIFQKNNGPCINNCFWHM